MSSIDPSLNYWGKLTSLNPAFDNICLKKNPSYLKLPHKSQECCENISIGHDQCEIYKDKSSYFVKYTGRSLSIFIENQALLQDKTYEISSGDNLTLIPHDQKERKAEFIFSSELPDPQRTP